MLGSVLEGASAIAMNRRIRTLSLLFAAAAALVALRLFWVQFPGSDVYGERASLDGERRYAVPAPRGMIRDAAGRDLARDRCSYELHLVPSRFRDRSFLFAFADLVWMCDPGAAVSSHGDYDALVRRLAADGGRTAGDFLALPAGVLKEKPGLRRRSASLLAEGGGSLLRGEEELDLRLRQALNVLAQRPLFKSRDQVQRLPAAWTAGQAVQREPAAVIGDLRGEVASLTGLALELGLEDVADLLGRIEALMAGEIRWVQTQYERELRSAAALEYLGYSDLSAARMGAREWARFARREVGLPFADDGEGERAASDAIQAMAAILGGELPGPAAGGGAGVPPSPAAEAARAGLFDLREETVVRAWFERISARPDFVESELIAARRRRDLRNRDRGGRSWRMGGDLSTRVANDVVGPGRLGDLGFSLKASFTRDEVLAEGIDAATRWIVGEVSSRERRGVRGVEAALESRLAGTPGEVVVDRRGDVLSEKLPVPGEDLSVSLLLSLQEELARILSAEPAAGVAVVDVATGGVLGLGTSPAPASPAEAVREREEVLLARRWLRDPEGPDAERAMSGRLRFLLEHGATEADVRERLWLRDMLSRTAAEREAERRLLGLRTWNSSGWHHGFECEGALQPGSVFKALTILAGLDLGVVNRDTVFDCAGTRARFFHRCKDHGAALDIATALGYSCNEYCYRVADMLGADALVDFYRRLAYFDEVPGLLPSMGEHAERSLRMDAARNLAIGGGSLDCSPLKAAALMASIAAGRVVRPWVCLPGASEHAPPPVPMPSSDHLDAIRAGLEAACGPRGTARRHAARLAQFEVAGKTGTHDFTTADGSRRNQAWFVGYAPRGRPRFAFAVVYLASEREGADAVPLALQVIEAARRTSLELR